MPGIVDSQPAIFKSIFVGVVREAKLFVFLCFLRVRFAQMRTTAWFGRMPKCVVGDIKAHEAAEGKARSTSVALRPMPDFA